MPMGLKYSYTQMPKSTETAEGMKILAGEPENAGCVILPDAVYAVKDGRELHLRMICPRYAEEKTDAKYPLLIHIQGSAWMKQNMRDHIPEMIRFAEAGYICAVVEYRESSIAKIPAQAEDAKDAARYLAAKAEELKIDLSRVYMSGDSSGGHTCLLCWATWQTPGLLDGGEGPLPQIRKFVDFYGPTDLRAMTEQISAMEHTSDECPESLAMGCRALDPEQQERVKACSVLTYLDPNTENAPLLILHGNKDRLVPFGQSVLLYNAAKAAGKNVSFYCVDNADHGGPSFYCRPVYETVLNFIAG